MELNFKKPAPWMSYLASKYLDDLIQPEWSVFEWGSGESTIYFSQRVKRVVSIEHDKQWYQSIKELIGINVDYKFIEPELFIIGNDISNPRHYTSNSFAIGNFRKYVSAIDDYNDKFDLIFIDGRSRASCLLHAINKINPDGWIVIDDADRNYYLVQTEHLFDGWENVLVSGLWKTLFIKNRKKS